MELAPFKSALAIPSGRIKIKYLSSQEVDCLTYTFQDWFDQSPSTGKKRKIRGRYWLVYLVLRFTGARLGEVIEINDTVDIDFRASDIRVVTLKRRNEKPKRIVPVPSQVVSEIATFLADFPDIRGKVFAVDANNFRKVFYQMAKESKLLKEEGVRSNGSRELFPHHIPFGIRGRSSCSKRACLSRQFKTFWVIQVCSRRRNTFASPAKTPNNS